ncbi:hypothetical protein VOLCADRAFT_88869 [Volvox carteri f. nagariensis]|uniref:Pentacotripeptide-repeat region of PRORP domain-containing protein n=1 Tax=Volvox carteri f. nagariensis TaxID=3068 RepID=D8TQ65_VOLCA|nr:uncharacterized protein VOLCADRAFT_88869 [Volvox carteri f. nagariensis]EFJ50481.1 hypothetical protein VOLCADRAFT_88869 [Volvox carteri f. nagariensis]|eukprot:XP_002948606.1 hypothetical protein VOLCADRAFT_88869 [Volvox carteri f. nagariensis]
MAAIYFRAEDLARRTVEYHRVREAEHRSRDRYGRRFRAFPWSEAVAAVLSDEALEDEASVVALIKELGRQGCSEVALAALDLAVTRGSPAPSKAMFDAVLLVCATEHQDQRCLEQYGRMRCLGLHPDLGTANLVLTGLCSRGRLAAAVEMLGEMRAQLGIRPNSYSVLMVLQACNHKRRGAYREAIAAVQELEAGGRTANEEVIEALLQVCEAAMQRSPSFEAALEVFSALSEVHLSDCTRMYNGLLAAAGRAGRWREAQALYARMQEDDVPPSLETHTALIQACVVGRALDHALHIFEHLVSGRSAHEAVPASIATYNHLIHACHQPFSIPASVSCVFRKAREERKVVLPRNLRPAPYDAMRVMYLDHLDMLQQEEMLALEKLGSLGSWASRSLTRGSATPTASGSLTSAFPSAATSMLTPASTMMTAAVTGMATASSTTSATTATAAMRSALRGPGSPSRPLGTAGSSATTSSRSMMPGGAAGYDNRQGYAAAAWQRSVGGGGRALSPSSNFQPQQQQQPPQQQQWPPPANPGGSPNFAAFGQGPWLSPGSGPGHGVSAAAAAAERSAVSSRCGHSRSSLRSMTMGHGNGGAATVPGGGGGSFRVAASAANGTALPPLSGEMLTPGTSSLPPGMATSPRSQGAGSGSGAAAVQAAAAAVPPPAPGLQRSRAAWSYVPHPGGGGAADGGMGPLTAAASSEFNVPSPLPSLSAVPVPVSVSAGGASRRFPVAVWGGGGK